MRAVRSSDGKVHVFEAPQPVALDGHELVRVTGSGICGSDLHAIAGGFAGGIIGHEFGGRLADGTLVVVRPTGECGACTACLDQRPNLCRDATARLQGFALDGGLAEWSLVERGRIVVVPDGVDERDVGLVEPIAVAVHGVRRAGVESGMRALVIGAGSIGLLTVAALRSKGVDVDIVARHEHQRVAADALGAGVEPSKEYDVVFDAVCTQASIDEAIGRARKGGTVVEYGMFWEPVSFSNALMYREITFVPSMYYSHDANAHDFVDAAQLLADQPTVAQVVVTHRFGLDDAVEAFRVAGDRRSGAIKVQVHP